MQINLVDIAQAQWIDFWLLFVFSLESSNLFWNFSSSFIYLAFLVVVFSVDMQHLWKISSQRLWKLMANYALKFSFKIWCLITFWLELFRLQKTLNAKRKVLPKETVHCVRVPAHQQTKTLYILWNRAKEDRLLLKYPELKFMLQVNKWRVTNLTRKMFSSKF